MIVQLCAREKERKNLLILVLERLVNMRTLLPDVTSLECWQRTAVYICIQTVAWRHGNPFRWIVGAQR